MDTTYFHPLDSLEGPTPGLKPWIAPQTRTAQIADWQGSPALVLDGLLLFPGLSLASGRLEVEIAAQAACYPGLVFRAAGPENYELTYAQPHTSGQWDAIQYDPVFNHSNTWQLYSGEAFQKTAQVPTGCWYRLRVDFGGRRAAVQVDDQPPLIVEPLAHTTAQAGMVGLWTYLPAAFRSFSVQEGAALSLPKPAPRPSLPAGTVRAWEQEDGSRLACEPHGLLNLNRWHSLAGSPARLQCSFRAGRATEATLRFGFSDELRLELDGSEIFSGQNRFKGFDDRAGRGYVEPQAHCLRLPVAAGAHRLRSTLAASEYFGWGLAMSIEGTGVQLMEEET